MLSLDRFDYNNYHTIPENTSDVKSQLEQALPSAGALTPADKERLARRCLRLGEYFLHIERKPREAELFLNFAVANLTGHQQILAKNQKGFYYQQMLFSVQKDLRKYEKEWREAISEIDRQTKEAQIAAAKSCAATFKAQALEHCQAALASYAASEDKEEVKAVIFAQAVRALTFYEDGDRAKAYATYQEAINLSRRHQIYDTQYYRMLNRAAMIAAELGEIEPARAMFEECKAHWGKVLQVDLYNIYAARYLISHGDFLHTENCFNSAFACYQQAYDIFCAAEKDGKHSASALDALAKSLSFTRYNVHTAGAAAFAHVRLAKEYVAAGTLSPELEYRLAYAIAIYYLFKERDLVSARTYLGICFKHTQPKADAPVTVAHAVICNLIGHSGTIDPTFTDGHYFTIAENFFWKAPQSQDGIHYQLELVFALRYLALSHHRNSMDATRKGDKDNAAIHAKTAVSFIQTALKLHLDPVLATAAKNYPLYKISHAEVLHLRGVMLRQQGQEQAGIESLYEARVMEQEMHDLTGYPHFLEATTDQSIADILVKRNDIPQDLAKIRSEAESRLLAALKLQNSLFTAAHFNGLDREHEDVQKTLHFLGDTYAALKDYRRAAEYYDRSANIKRARMGADHDWTKKAEALAASMRAKHAAEVQTTPATAPVIDRPPSPLRALALHGSQTAAAAAASSSPSSAAIPATTIVVQK